MGESKMDKKMKRKLLLAGFGLGLTFTEAYLQNKISKNKDEKIEKLITEVRNELGGSRIEITPKHIKMRTEKLDIIDGADLTLDTNEITVNKHEKQFNSLSSKVDTLDENISRRLEELEDEVFTPVEDLYASDAYHYRVRLPESSVEVSPDEVKLKGDTITFGKDVKLARYEKEIENLKYQVKMLEEWHTPKQDPVPIDFDEENTVDKSPVLQGIIDTENFVFPSTLEEYNNLYKLTCDLVNKLDTDNLEKLNVIWSGSYMYDMKDFHSLVAQIFVIQEASKKKGENKNDKQ